MEVARESASKEAESYARLGASSSKDGVHTAVGSIEKSYFVELTPDAATPESHFSLLHADGAGTKSITAYLCFRETGDTRWFRGLAQDALVMNLDDIACVNAFEGLSLSNTLGRNRHLVPDEAIGAIIDSYREICETLRNYGISIELAGGETADLGDLVRTILVDATMFARVRKDRVVRCDRARAGDVLVGFSSTGQAIYEDTPNSGIASNGLTLARHALIHQKYAEKYPEILDPGLAKSDSYQGTSDLFDTPEPLQQSVAEALLSPTRTYAPIVRKVCDELGAEIRGIFHCTGGGQTKPVRFGENKRYVKDNLFPCPPVFSLIQQSMNVPWKEMYAVFNMGHRVEILCSEKHVNAIVDVAREFEIDAQQIGYVEDNPGGNVVEVRSEHGSFEYT